MTRTRSRSRAARPAAALPLRTALVLSTVVFLSACTSSAEIESGQRADVAAEAAAAGETATPLVVDTSSEQADRVRTDEDPDAAGLVPATIAEDGVLRVGVVGSGEPPLGFLADDNATVVGSEVDIASLVADSVGLELEVVNVAWEQWPLALQSGDLEAVFSNVGVNAARLELFDFATYREGVMAFTAATGSDLSIEGPEDVAGLTVAVGSGTNQERILLDWNAQNEAAGLEPATLEYYANVADTMLALQSGRIDTYLGPNPNAVYQASVGEVDIVGTVNAGWPNTTYVAATTLKGTGLVDAVQAALQHVFDDGTYERTLQRWGLGDEAVDAPEVNPEVAS
ncbi:ABC transporter substrate-binding protein [Geodermatophilus sabuli]|uniref:Amino acid ABC transporter substrate-binding protein, PAAT family n=1 Tax=Geodermatophilus sabuli TaxID=1564158 RepID=A0A285EJ72_9ACTN|nr:ABC transporter substrate-binding protein [Geodermatophilus sabuli]MBB3083749.1 polar amino acid transport system substrate-binding protein [Geodermatophilus sabuli]SNX99179.1 amino acid ABC transporter substrate-binding protein, PAAT family [Geodermatophilus sabuli]